MQKQPNLFYGQHATLPKDALAKFYISTAFGLSFMISSVAPTRSSTFCTYLITKSETVTLTKTSQMLITSSHTALFKTEKSMHGK